MDGPIAQMIALACHGNAFLTGASVPIFFPSNSTCQFCDRVNYVEVIKLLFGGRKEIEVAQTPDDWFHHLKGKEVRGLRLLREPQSIVQFPDRMSAGLEGGGGTWVFGGMGSWNDLGFEGAEENEYERVSEQLFQALNEAVCAAANTGFLKAGAQGSAATTP